MACARGALPLCWWGCREGCRLGILKCGGEGGGEGEGGGGDGGAVGEGDEVDNVFGALKLWGADGALAVPGACGGEAVCHGYAERGVTEAFEGVIECHLAFEGDLVRLHSGKVAVHVAPCVTQDGARGGGEEEFAVLHAEEDRVLAVVGVRGGAVYGGDVPNHCVPKVGRDATAYEVAHGLGAMAAEAAALVSELIVAVAHVKGPVEDAAPDALLGGVGERRAQ